VNAPATTGRRAQTKAANRAAILAAALDVFAELGYGAAGVRDVIRRTELAPGTFYNYFPDKESVFRALVGETVEVARGRVAAARAGADTGTGFIEDAYRAYFSFIVEDPERHAFLSRNWGRIRLEFDDAGLPGAIADLRADLEAAIVGGALPAVDVEYTAQTMIAVGLELAGLLVRRDPPDVEGATRFATGLFVGGLGGTVASPS